MAAGVTRWRHGRHLAFRNYAPQAPLVQTRGGFVSFRTHSYNVLLQDADLDIQRREPVLQRRHTLLCGRERVRVRSNWTFAADTGRFFIVLAVKDLHRAVEAEMRCTSSQREIPPIALHMGRRDRPIAETHRDLQPYNQRNTQNRFARLDESTTLETYNLCLTCLLGGQHANTTRDHKGHIQNIGPWSFG